MRKITLLITLAIFSIQSFAQDIYGGEITWECIKSGPDIGKYQFSMALYYDCSSGTPLAASQMMSIENSSFPAVSLTRMSDVDISVPCYDPVAKVSCANSSPEAVSKALYQSSPTTLSGTPPTSGWVFTWTDCCRPATDNLTTGQGYTLRSVMYPYNGQNANPCYDDSPRFLEYPLTSVCDDYQMNFNQHAVDPDLDEAY